MTIEAKLDETNNLLRQLLAALNGGLKTATPQADVQPAKPAAEAKPPEPAANATPTDYARDVRPPMMELVKLKGNLVVRGILAALGVDNAKNLKPEQWPEFLARIAAVKADDTIPTVGA